MDLWVVAAVAGAGCLARYLNKLSKNVDGSSHLSLEDSYFENDVSPFQPFCTQAGRDSLYRRASDVNSEDCLLASDEGLESEKVRLFRNCSESDVLSVSNFNDYGNEQASNVVGKCDFLPSDLSAGKLGHNPHGNRTSHRTNHLYGHISRPSNSLESCLMAQLCEEQVKLEESVFLPSMATRSLLVGDGKQVISRANDDDSFSGLTGSEEYRLNREANKVKDKSVLFGVPSLSKIGSSNDAKKMKLNAGNGRSKRLSSTSNVFSGKHIHTQHDASFLFSLGISFGIITSLLANKREMDNLRELLKETENLVEDLQEGLEMKDSMRVKELHNRNYGSQGTYDHSLCDKELNGFSPEKHMDNFPITDCKKSYDQKEEESSESMSKIEAELEAELERLGLNMNEPDQERPQSELVELDPDFVADFAQGELQTDVIDGKGFFHSELNEDDSGTLVPVNYAVSPHELTLRLHEVNQSRLEGRVQELEIALENSERKLWFMESEHESDSQKCFPREGNLLACNDCEPMTEPLVMNLSDDPPGVYNDTYYEEIIKIDDFEENSPSSIHITECEAANEERLSRELSSGEVTMLEGLSSSNYGSNDVGDETCECDYEMERQLIRQIVERTKKGSPVFHNARRILYSMDKDEH
ncbi:hypothetical protein PHAVU_003G184800 [Phaseolus vulgaris]|uniref:Uncharacterized protein n=1 Tax=Phaseolus vulgaris TaxID=3885 RepID=V7CD84_PHAVU|nr:hypothetical protein PHAVU_003G184800g [Phaseolus vulgaris]ESW27230.1 hypothetical protein PHAVU_003G184800g [Phaseolus vulgaris]